MNPFLVFGLDLDATDDDVSARYHELLAQHPPDRHPESFSEIRRAYESLKDGRSRLRTWLFAYDRFGRDLLGSEKLLLEIGARPRMDPVSLASLIRGSRHEVDDE